MIKFLEDVVCSPGEELVGLCFNERVLIPDAVLNAVLSSMFPQSNLELRRAQVVIDQWFESLRKDGYTALQFQSPGDSISITGTKQPLVKRTTITDFGEFSPWIRRYVERCDEQIGKKFAQFTDEDGGRILARTVVKEEFQKICEDADITMEITFK